MNALYEEAVSAKGLLKYVLFIYFYNVMKNFKEKQGMNDIYVVAVSAKCLFRTSEFRLFCRSLRMLFREMQLIYDIYEGAVPAECTFNTCFFFFYCDIKPSN